MKKYYYVCPRCGRKWRFFFRHKTMKCPFCNEEWEPYSSKYSKLTSSRFSFTASLVWLVILLVLACVGLKVAGYDGVALEKAKAFLGDLGVYTEKEEEQQPETKKEAPYRPWATREIDGVKKSDKASEEESLDESENLPEVELPAAETSDDAQDVRDELLEPSQQVVPGAKSDSEW